jgi:hypothetical protein
MTPSDLDNAMIWRAMLLVRDKSNWTGNRFEVQIAGVAYTLQRRGRREVEGGLKKKFNDTFFARNDHGWVIIARDYNFQDIPLPNVLDSTPFKRQRFDTCREQMCDLFMKKKIDFIGDFDLFGRDFVMLKMFGGE